MKSRVRRESALCHRGKLEFSGCRFVLHVSACAALTTRRRGNRLTTIGVFCPTFLDLVRQAKLGEGGS
jgi:hypothetical protein